MNGIVVTLPALIVAFAALIGAVTGIVTVSLKRGENRSGARRTDAEIFSVVSQAEGRLRGDLSDRLDKAEARLEGQDRKIATLEGEVRQLKEHEKALETEKRELLSRVEASEADCARVTEELRVCRLDLGEARAELALLKARVVAGHEHPEVLDD